ncbi:hypothetical protein O181_042509 [Austropuccinia psidii MF-1]|uniref:Uncharacterized protein n=1 Tax=Austropuccinia psidii MF-1 TaxID=1389203 RepID=A0A9Q3HHJ2_9BASI|nr:hypothetical protein [Austropuccinia psidii MF-1]
MRPRGAKGAVHQPPNHKWAHWSQFWPKNSQNHLRTKIDQGSPVGHYLAHGLWQPPEATSSSPSKDSPQFQGKTFPSSMQPILKDPGVVHIWYNIPLCTIFSQQSNGEILRTKLRDSKSSTQSITNFKGGSFSYFSLAITWWLPENHLRTPTTWPCRGWVVISHQDYSKGNSQRLSIISIIVKGESTQKSLDNSIGTYR